MQCSTLKSTVVQYNSWHTGAGIDWTGKKSYWREGGEEVGDGRAEGSSAIGDRGQAAWLDWHDWTCEHTFASLKVHNLKVHM